MKKRIVIVDDHVSIRQMLTSVLRREAEYEVVGEAGTGTEAMSLCERLRPELVILDLMLPELCGTEVIRRLRSARNRPRLLVYSGTQCRHTIANALQYRPDGFVEKSGSLRMLFDGIKTVLNGCTFFSPFISTMLYDSPAAERKKLSLTPRERQVLRLTVDGCSCKETATQLGISVKTVEFHRQKLMKKFSAQNSAALVRMVLRDDLLAN